ncbi:Hypothetical predicted protein, partial [Marmota monax]
EVEKLSRSSIVDEEEQYISSESSTSISLHEEPSYFRPVYKGESDAFCIQLFCIDEKYEA